MPKEHESLKTAWHRASLPRRICLVPWLWGTLFKIGRKRLPVMLRMRIACDGVLDVVRGQL